MNEAQSTTPPQPELQPIPLIRKHAETTTFVWPDYALSVDADRFNHTGAGELYFWHGSVARERPLLYTRVDLLSSNSTAQAIRRLQKIYNDIGIIPWEWVFCCIATKVIDDIREGEPIIDILPNEDTPLKPTYLVEPIVYQSHPAVIFGRQGSTKSTLALVIAHLLQFPDPDSRLGLITPAETRRVLYLDYEDDPLTFQARWGALQRGFGPGPLMPIKYRRMERPVGEDVEKLREIIAADKIDLLIVDSLGLAAGGTLYDPEPAIEYFRALRKLKVTSLSLAHTSKDTTTKEKTIFGSVYFMNLARSIWECKADPEIDGNQAVISLTNTKHNYSKKHHALGLRFTFTDNDIKVTRADLADSSLSGELPIPWQIKGLLRDGALTAADICELLGKGDNTIRPTLTRMRKAGDLVKVDGHKWGLKHGN